MQCFSCSADHLYLCSPSKSQGGQLWFCEHPSAISFHILVSLSQSVWLEGVCGLSVCVGLLLTWWLCSCFSLWLLKLTADPPDTLPAQAAARVTRGLWVHFFSTLQISKIIHVVFYDRPSVPTLLLNHLRPEMSFSPDSWDSAAQGCFIFYLSCWGVQGQQRPGWKWLE